MTSTTPDPGTARRSSAPSGDYGSVPGAGDTAFVRVSAATVWTKPGLERPGVDDPSLGMPVDLDAWNAAMPDTEPRAWLTGKLETQGLLGAKVIVDEVDGDWAKVVVTDQPSPDDPRGYPGWMPLAQLVVDAEFESAVAARPTARVTAKRTTLTAVPSGDPSAAPSGDPSAAPSGDPSAAPSGDSSADDGGLEISFNTILPVLGQDGDWVQVAVPGSQAQRLTATDVVVRQVGEAVPTPTVEDVIATGERFLGLRYLWAGMSSWGYDCSGYVYTLFHHHGITLPRDAGPQMTHSGMPRVERADLRRGDVVFFAYEPGGEAIRHVAMYVGDDRIMHAPNASRSVEVISLAEYDPKGEYAGAVRVLEQ